MGGEEEPGKTEKLALGKEIWGLRVSQGARHITPMQDGTKKGQKYNKEYEPQGLKPTTTYTEIWDFIHFSIKKR